MGLNPTEENITPVNNTSIHTAINLLDFKLKSQSKQPLATYAAANGAVIADEIPAANNPILKKYFAKLPKSGSILFAKSAALLISELLIDAADLFWLLLNLFFRSISLLPMKHVKTNYKVLP